MHSNGPGMIQTKLKINEPGDIYEQEADRVADAVMRMPAHPGVTSALLRIQRYTGHPTGQADIEPASVDRVLSDSGRPLEPALRQDMEQRFGHDFSRVRVHSGVAAEQSARDVSAHAYTVGRNIVFGAGQFAPGSHEGRRLILECLSACCLALFANSCIYSAQKARDQPIQSKLKVCPSGNRYEQEADRVAEQVMRMLDDRGVPQSLEHGGEIANMDDGAFEVAPDSRAQVVGAQVAEAVYGGLKQ